YRNPKSERNPRSEFSTQRRERGEGARGKQYSAMFLRLTDAIELLWNVCRNWQQNLICVAVAGQVGLYCPVCSGEACVGPYPVTLAVGRCEAETEIRAGYVWRKNRYRHNRWQDAEDRQIEDYKLTAAGAGIDDGEGADTRVAGFQCAS